MLRAYGARLCEIASRSARLLKNSNAALRASGGKGKSGTMSVRLAADPLDNENVGRAIQVEAALPPHTSSWSPSNVSRERKINC